MTYKSIMLEICGKCNAQCLYCYTGRVNRGMDCDEGTLMSVENFRKCLDFLIKKRLCDQSTHFCLYNYGEPLLHPHLAEIMEIINSSGMTFEISTNGSILPSESFYKNISGLTMMKFSMCGFSDESYKKISRLSFEICKEHIAKIVYELRANGWKGIANLKFHVYKHNMEEVICAKQFAEDNGIVFSPIHAIIGDLKLQTDWIDNLTDNEFNDSVRRDLVSANIFKSMVLDKPDNWICPLTKELVVDERLQVINCCMATRNDKQGYERIGSLFEYHDIISERCQSEVERRCLMHGVGYAICNIPTYIDPLLLDEIENVLSMGTVDVIGDDFVFSSFASVFDKYSKEWNHFSDVESYIKKGTGNSLIVADGKFGEIRKQIKDYIGKNNILVKYYHYNIRK